MLWFSFSNRIRAVVISLGSGSIASSIILDQLDLFGTEQQQQKRPSKTESSSYILNVEGG